MKTEKLLKTIYTFLDDAKARAYIQYANDGSAKGVVSHLFYEIDRFFMRLEEDLETQGELE